MHATQQWCVIAMRIILVNKVDIFHSYVFYLCLINFRLYSKYVCKIEYEVNG